MKNIHTPHSTSSCLFTPSLLNHESEEQGYLSEDQLQPMHAYVAMILQLSTLWQWSRKMTMNTTILETFSYTYIFTFYHPQVALCVLMVNYI